MLTTTILLRMVASLAVTLGLVVLAAYAYKHMSRQSQKSWLPGYPATRLPKRLQVLETQRLTPQTTLHLVRLDDTEHLLSVTAAQTTLISSHKSPKTK